VTVKNFIDGDTVHFYVPTTVTKDGVLKARFLAVDTPESTGKIEEYGKAASRYTRETLEKAKSIYIESDDANWNVDSTGDRYLVWVWYQTEVGGPYRNLNLELLQNGLAVGSSAANNRYGSLASAALSQSMQAKLNIFSGKQDPDYYYGDAVELTLKELRCNIESYNGVKVAFNGVVTLDGDNTVYVESYDADTEMYYGMTVYYGFNLSGPGLEILQVGNEVRIVATVQYYEIGGTWQVAGLSYRQMKPKDPNNIQKLSDGHAAAYTLTTADKFVNGKVDVDTDTDKKTYDYAPLAMSTSIRMNDLVVKDIYTTTDEASSSKGAMTLTCEVDGITISVRTAVLRNADGSLITEEAYKGKTIDVLGIVDFYDGKYQIKVYEAKNIIVKN
jgi:endonuclease YncB( thermonuclease family)